MSRVTCHESFVLDLTVTEHMSWVSFPTCVPILQQSLGPTHCTKTHSVDHGELLKQCASGLSFTQFREQRATTCCMSRFRAQRATACFITTLREQRFREQRSTNLHQMRPIKTIQELLFLHYVRHNDVQAFELCGSRARHSAAAMVDCRPYSMPSTAPRRRH